MSSKSARHYDVESREKRKETERNLEEEREQFLKRNYFEQSIIQ